MRQGHLVDLDAHLALSAAPMSADAKLAMADSVILARARQRQATLWRQDANFEGMADFRYIARH